MPRRGGRHQVLVKGAEHAMEAFKLEVARDIGLGELIGEEGNYKALTTLQVGQLGGEMVRRIQAAGEWAIKIRFDQHAERLLPEDILPDKKRMRDVSNNGNISPSVHVNPRTHTMESNTGQEWQPGNNALTDGSQQQ